MADELLAPKNFISPQNIFESLQSSHKALCTASPEEAFDILNNLHTVEYDKESVVRDLDIIDSQVNALFSDFMTGRKPSPLEQQMDFIAKLPELISYGKNLYGEYLEDKNPSQELKDFLHSMERALTLPFQYKSYFESHGLILNRETGEFVLNQDTLDYLTEEIEIIAITTGRNIEEVDKEFFQSSRNMANLLMTSLVTTQVSPEVRDLHIKLARKAEAAMQDANLELTINVFRLWKAVGIKSYDEYLEIMGYPTNTKESAIRAYEQSVNNINTLLESENDNTSLERLLYLNGSNLSVNLNDPSVLMQELENLQALFDLHLPEGTQINVELSIANGASPRNMQIGNANGGSTVILNPYVGLNTPSRFLGHEKFAHGYHNAIIEVQRKYNPNLKTRPSGQVKEWFAAGIETAVAKVTKPANAFFNKIAGFVIGARINSIGLINYEVWSKFNSMTSQTSRQEQITELKETFKEASNRYFQWKRIDATNVFGAGRSIDPFWTTDGLIYLSDDDSNSQPLFNIMNGLFGERWIENLKAKQITICLMADSALAEFSKTADLIQQIDFYLNNLEALQNRLLDLKKLGFELK